MTLVISKFLAEIRFGLTQVGDLSALVGIDVDLEFCVCGAETCQEKDCEFVLHF